MEGLVDCLGAVLIFVIMFLLLSRETTPPSSPLFCYCLPATFLCYFLSLSLFGSWEKTDCLCWDFWSQRPAGTLELLTGACQAEWLTYRLPDQLILPLLLRWNRGRWWREEESSHGLWIGCHAQIYMCQLSKTIFYSCRHKCNIRNAICKHTSVHRMGWDGWDSFGVTS